jgi:hypothetical protein
MIRMTLNKKAGLFLGTTMALSLAAATMWSTQSACAQPGSSSSQATAQAGVAGDSYQLKTEVVGECKAGTECTAKITINVTANDFHVNDQFPFKFTAADAPGVEFHGSAGNVFKDGDFVREKKTATMTVKFKPSAKGNVTIGGKYKICVCSEQNCQPTTIDVSIPVVVK